MDDQEISDWMAFLEGRPGARACLVERYKPFVKNSVRRYCSRLPWVEEDDLEQLCWLGVNLALDKFNIELGYQFSTYADYHVRRALYSSPEVKRGLSRSQAKIVSKIRREHERLMQEKGSAPTIEELCQATGFTPQAVHSALDTLAACFPLSIETLLNAIDDADKSSLLVDLSQTIDERANGGGIDPEELKEAMQLLDPRDREVLILTYWDGLSDEEIVERISLPSRKNGDAADKDELKRKLVALRKIRSRAYKRLKRILNKMAR